MSHKKRNTTPYCLNCHYPTAEFDSFCPNCGQKATDGKVTLHDLVHEFVHSILHVDGKVFTTLRHLFIPGKLTVEFFAGHHKRYAHPIQLFIVLCGLSLIFSSKSHKKIETTFEKGTIDKVQVENKSLIFELDSMAKMRYTTTPSVSDSLHHLLIEKYRIYGEKQEKQTLLEEDAFSFTIDAIQENKKNIAFLNTYLKTHADTTNHFRIQHALSVYQKRLDFLKKDSVILYQKLTVVLQKTEEDIEKLKNKTSYKLGRSIGGQLARKAVHGNEGLEEALVFTDTVQAQNITLSIEDRLKINKIIDANTIKRDSTRLLFAFNSKIKIDDRDIINLPFSDIVKKYKIEGTVNTVLARITYNFTKDGISITHAFLGKKMYIYVILILPLAWFMQLLYRRQHRYYVEHIVFLMHYFCLSFLLEAPSLFWNMNDGWLFYASHFLEYLIILPLALKRYYQQGWLKTCIKAILIVLGLYGMALFIFLLGLLLSMVVA